MDLLKRKMVLNISSTGKNSEILKKYNQVSHGIKYHIKKINNNDSKYDKNYMKIKFNTDDDIPLNKELNFPSITVIIRCVFEKDSSVKWGNMAQTGSGFSKFLTT